MTRKNWNDYFLDLATEVAERSTCPRLHVGAVITTPDHRIISTGYNGAPAGAAQCDQRGCLMKHDHCIRTIHAEVNAFLDPHRLEVKDGILYVTHTPCFHCSKVIVNSGISTVHIKDEYGPGGYLPNNIEVVLH